MRTNTWIYIVIAVLFIASGAWFYFFSSNQSSITIPQEQGNVGTTANGQVRQPNAGANAIKFDLAIGSSPSLGEYLATYNPTTKQKNMTLYTFAKDIPGTSTCHGDCATNWPPLYIQDFVASGAGGTIHIKDLAVIRREGGTQLTYKGMPLYFYKGDTKAGDTKGEGVAGLWHVAKP